MRKTVKYNIFPFRNLTLLVGQQEGHPVCKKLGVGLLILAQFSVLLEHKHLTRQVFKVLSKVRVLGVGLYIGGDLTGALHVTTTSIILSSSKIQNGDILVLAYRLYWKVALK